MSPRHALRYECVYTSAAALGHGGLLSFGDTFSYALARGHHAPLLFVGDDFGTTDLTAALEPPDLG
jgi:uncharacterized protein with PIN domain